MSGSVSTPTLLHLLARLVDFFSANSFIRCTRYLPAEPHILPPPPCTWCSSGPQTTSSATFLSILFLSCILCMYCFLPRMPSSLFLSAWPVPTHFSSFNSNVSPLAGLPWFALDWQRPFFLPCSHYTFYITCVIALIPQCYNHSHVSISLEPRVL